MREATGFNEENHRHLKKQTYGEQTEGGFGRSVVDAHYLWSPHLWIHLLANIYL